MLYKHVFRGVFWAIFGFAAFAFVVVAQAIFGAIYEHATNPLASGSIQRLWNTWLAPEPLMNTLKFFLPGFLLYSVYFAAKNIPASTPFFYRFLLLRLLSILVVALGLANAAVWLNDRTNGALRLLWEGSAGIIKLNLLGNSFSKGGGVGMEAFSSLAISAPSLPWERIALPLLYPLDFVRLVGLFSIAYVSILCFAMASSRWPRLIPSPNNALLLGLTAMLIFFYAY